MHFVLFTSSTTYIYIDSLKFSDLEFSSKSMCIENTLIMAYSSKSQLFQVGVFDLSSEVACNDPQRL